MPDADPSATLAGIRERQALASDASLGFSRMDERHDALIKVAYEDMPLALAALDAVLKLADDWTAESDELDDLSEKPGTDEEGCLILRGQAQAYHGCAQDLRAAITAELAGKPSAPVTAVREDEEP